jgi:hypothetical protein
VRKTIVRIGTLDLPITNHSSAIFGSTDNVNVECMKMNATFRCFHCSVRAVSEISCQKCSASLFYAWPFVSLLVNQWRLQFVHEGVREDEKVGPKTIRK